MPPTKRQREPAGPRGDWQSVVIWILTVLITVLISTFGVCILWPVSQIFDRRLFMMHNAARLWGRLILQINPAWRERITGLENLSPGENYVIIANHQSIADILVLLSIFPQQFKFVAKRELYKVPFLGWHMAASGYMALDRASPESGKAIMLKAINWLKRGASVLFFPEGTRSRDGRIYPFKLGAFKVAFESGCKILPIVIDGTGSAVPKHSWKLTTPSFFKVAVGAPVSLEHVKPEELARAAESVRQEMTARLAALRAKTA